MLVCNRIQLSTLVLWAFLAAGTLVSGCGGGNDSPPGSQHRTAMAVLGEAVILGKAEAVAPLQYLIKVLDSMAAFGVSCWLVTEAETSMSAVISQTITAHLPIG